jgi:dienelactone hydrolase
MRIRPPLLALIFAALAIAGCAGSGGGDPAPTATPTSISPAEAYTYERAVNRGPHAVGTLTLDLVDSSRPTMPNRDAPGSDERSLPTDVWYPAASDGRAAAVNAEAAPYPLIIWSHGFSSLPQLTQSLLSHIASHGYIVAAPAFPLTRLRAPGGANFEDTFNQAGDVSFVIDEMLRRNDDEASPLHLAIDQERIGAMGHSGGGFTTLLALYGSDRDERIDAAVPISASACFLAESHFGRNDAPVMFIAGTADRLFTIDGLRYAYENALPPRFWVSINHANDIRSTGVDLDDAVAEGLAIGIRAVANSTRGPSETNLLAGCAESTRPTTAALTLDRQQELLRAFITPFFEAYLREDAAALAFLTNGASAATAGAVEYEFRTE